MKMGWEFTGAAAILLIKRKPPEGGFSYI